jgi:hypothetical protein
VILHRANIGYQASQEMVKEKYEGLRSQAIWD